MSNAKPPDEKTEVTPPVTAKETVTPPATDPPKTAQELVTQRAQKDAKEPVVADPPVAKDPPAAAKKGDGEPVVIGDEDEIPEGVELFKMSKKALDKRLKRASSAELNGLFEAFGVKDRAELEAKVTAGKKAEADAEAARVAQLSKEEKLAEDLAKSQAEATAWRNKHNETLQSAQIKETQGHYEGLAKEFLDPDYIEDEMPRLGRHLLSKYKEEELRDLPDDVVRAYFQDRVKAKPKLAKDASLAPPPPRVAHSSAGDKVAATKSADPPASKDKGAPEATDFRPKKGETPEQRRQAAADIKQKYGISY